MVLEASNHSGDAPEGAPEGGVSASPLLALLVAHGRLSSADARRVTLLSAETGEQSEVLLTRLGLIAEEALARFLAETLQLPLVRAQDCPAVPIREEQLSAKFLKAYRVLPLAETEDGLAVAMANPLDRYALDALTLATGARILERVGVPAEIEAALDRMFASSGVEVEAVSERRALELDDAGEDIDRLRDLASGAPVIRLVNSIVGRAVEMRASDIHVEPFDRTLRVRYRVDGVLRDVPAPPRNLRAAIVSRIKLMARLNIAETRLPQDGRIRIVNRGTEMDLRVSTVPTMHGESVVLRILDKGGVELSFDALGFDEEPLERYLAALDQPHGIVLVTGPTGSGKTTTLYTSLQRLNTGERKILAAEDPVEYQLEGVNQVQVRSQVGLTFASALRAFLRQDPDVIMIGEIRDLETAEIAIQSALTGHKVLSTVHTNDAASTITRLLDMGVQDYLITSTVNAVTAQRLVRTVCPHCRERFECLPEVSARLGLDLLSAGTPVSLWRGAGCERCSGSGYLGRTSVLEVLAMTDAIRHLVLRRAEAQEIRRAAAAQGMRTMHQDGLLKALRGVTTLEEVARVTHDA